MRFTILTAFICCLYFTTSFAQTTYGIKGAIIDSAEIVKLSNTTITVMNAKDSILCAFTRTAENGNFSINNLSKGNFLLLVTYPGYADYVEAFSLDSAHSHHDFGLLNMILKSRLLSEVIIKGQVTAIKIKGDTTEFNAKAYKIQPNDKVEDLLRQLPGIQVDKDGKITAQGQTVNKILVDGEEFFGDDPTLVTKNLRADMVDKVQLYDKKSDQATFTGIDDGVKTKTINIKLLEDKKNGYFGKADAEAGTNKYYQDQLLFNKFKAKQKFSAYGILSNNGKLGLGWQDANKYGTSNENVVYGDDGMMYVYSDGGGGDLDSYNGQYDNNGLPTARTGGLHYDSKWNADKESINTSYKIGSLQVDGLNTTESHNNLPEGVINTDSKAPFHKFIFRQKLDLTYQIKLDTTSNLKLDISGTQKNNNVDENYTTTSYKGADSLLNNNIRSVTNKVDEKDFGANAFYTKKFKKVGRTLSFLVHSSLNQSDARGYLKSKTDYYKQNLIDSTQVIDQYKTNHNSNTQFTTNLTYTEPLSKKLSLIFNYGIGVNNGTSNRQTLDSTSVNHYDRLDTALSSNYQLNQLTNQAGAMLNYKAGKSILNFGTKVADVSFKQYDAYTDFTFKQHFINWQPQASYQYRFSQQEFLWLNYRGSSTQPRIDQVQPVRVNTDPLNISIGNPDLKPSFNNNLQLSYNSYKVLTSQQIYLSGYYSLTSNPIVSKTFTDTTGKSTYQSVNLAGRQPYYYEVSGMFDRKIKPFDLNIGLVLSTNGNASYNYSNGALNTTTSYYYSGSLRLSKYEVKKYQFYINFGPTYSINRSSLQKQINNNGGGFNTYGSFTIYLPGKFQLSSDGNYSYTAKTQTFDNALSKFIVNASLIKTFLKDENLKFAISGNDLLNQNTGYYRYSNGNVFGQNTNTTIKRYVMFSVVWDFNHAGGAKDPKK